jgi:tripartite ATP-independent transporter DctM subunit
MTATYLTVILFFLLVICGVPVSVSLILGIIVSLFVFDVYPLLSVATLFYNSLDSYLLVAIPLFMFTGIAMSHGGLAKRVFDFTESLIGFLPGSLGSVTVMASMIFGGMSGSSAADVAGLGPIQIKEMVSRKYPPAYAAAITVASSTLAVIIPPSILLIIYATIANASVGDALAAGLLPGLLITAVLIALNSYFAFRNKWTPSQTFSGRRLVRTGFLALPALLAPVIILGGIFKGIFTPTEASAIAFVYCLLVGFVVYRELNAKKLYAVVYEGGRTSGIVALELASGLIFSNLMTIEGIPEVLTTTLTGASDNPLLIMIFINVVLLVAGAFLNPGFSIIVFTPLLLPVAQEIGFDTLHFGVIMVTNLALGLITPPVGACLFIGAVVSGIPVEKLIKSLLPFYAALVIALILIILWPWLSTGFVEYLNASR